MMKLKTRLLSSDNQSKDAQRIEDKDAANISSKEPEVLVENGVQEVEDQHSDDEFSGDDEKDDGNGNPDGN